MDKNIVIIKKCMYYKNNQNLIIICILFTDVISEQVPIIQHFQIVNTQPV